MPATLTIPVSDELLAHLQQRAAEQGTTPEAVAAEQLLKTIPPKPGDFLRKWIGAFPSGVPDWADNHDAYLGKALYDEMKGGGGAGDVR